MDVPRQAYAVLVRSPHAHARIVRIDTRGALKSPGVLAVLTGAEAAADARKPGVPVVWDEAPDNVAFVWSAGPKDAVTHAFESAPHVTRLPFVVSRVAVAPMEPRAAVGEYDRRTERYTLHTGIQGPH